MSGTAGSSQVSGDKEPERPGVHGRWLAILGVVLGVVALLVKTNFPLYVDTWLGVICMFAAMMAFTWMVDLLLLARKGYRRIVALSLTFLVTALSSALFIYEAQPPSRGDGAVDCKFGNFGLGYGRGWVWVKADVEKDAKYKVHVIWGAVEAEKEVELSREAYIVFRKEYFWSNGYTTIAIDPSVTLSCGNGMPSTGVQVIQIVDTDWHLRDDVAQR